MVNSDEPVEKPLMASSVFQAPDATPVSNYRLIMICVLAGVIGIFGWHRCRTARYRMIGLVTNLAYYQRFSTELVPHRSDHDWPLGLSSSLPIGGLIIGLMARLWQRTGGADTEIPEAMEAVLLKHSRIPAPKLAILKPISAAHPRLGRASPFGAEGPIIQTGAAIGSILGQALHTTASERKVLLACGSAGGHRCNLSVRRLRQSSLRLNCYCSSFRAPLVYSHWQLPRQLPQKSITSCSAPAPCFRWGAINFGGPLNLVFFLVLGGLSALCAMGLTSSACMWSRICITSRTSILTCGLPIGGLFCRHCRLSCASYDLPRRGCVRSGLHFDQWCAGGSIYDWISDSTIPGKSGRCGWLALGSGTSGGILAPLFLIGAALGGIFGLAVKALFPAMDAATHRLLRLWAWRQCFGGSNPCHLCVNRVRVRDDAKLSVDLARHVSPAWWRMPSSIA